MVKWFRPQMRAPMHREFLGKPFAREFEAKGPSLFVNELQVPEFVQKHVIQHKSPDSEPGPFPPGSGAELIRLLPHPKSLCQARSRRQSAQGYIPTTLIDITQSARTTAPIVEVNGSETLPQVSGEAAQDDANVVFADVVDPVSTRTGCRKLNLAWHRVH